MRQFVGARAGGVEKKVEKIEMCEHWVGLYIPLSPCESQSANLARIPLVRYHMPSKNQETRCWGGSTCMKC
jgi:hypothetical protein